MSEGRRGGGWPTATRKCVDHRYSFPDARFFLYVDSDAVISNHFAHLSLVHLVENCRHWVNWTMEEQPIVFNQDGPSWWRNLVTDTTNYTWCLNSGTVFWHRSHRATAVLKEWWTSSTDPYETNYPPPSERLLLLPPFLLLLLLLPPPPPPRQ